MNKKQAVKKLNEHIKRFKSLDKLSDDLYKNSYFQMNSDSLIHKSLWEMFESLTDEIETSIIGHCEYKWINWYLFDNQCGKRAFEAGPKDETKKIKSVTDLYWLMTN